MRRALPIALLVLAAGCGADAADSSDAAGSAKLRSALTYERSGGLTGRVYRLTVSPEGKAKLASPGKPTVRFGVGRPARENLVRKLRDARVAGRTADYTPDTPVADGIGNRVRYAGGEVTTATGADAPKPVESLVATLAELVRRRNP